MKNMLTTCIVLLAVVDMLVTSLDIESFYIMPFYLLGINLILFYASTFGIFSEQYFYLPVLVHLRIIDFKLHNS